MRALVTRPRWLLLHAAVLALAVGMLLLGDWQWERASDSGRVQNYAYAAQWLLFAVFTVVAYAKLARDEVRGPVEESPARVDLPAREQPAAPPESDDEELTAYNAYLKTLAEKSP